MKYAVHFYYETKVLVEANNPDQALERAKKEPIDRDDLYYIDDYDIEEVE